MVFQKSIIPGRGPILAIFRFLILFFREQVFFCIFLKKRIGNFRIWKSCTSITLTPKIFNNHTSKWPPAKLRFGAFSYVPTCMLEKKKTRCCLKPTFFHQTSLGATWYHVSDRKFKLLEWIWALGQDDACVMLMFFRNIRWFVRPCPPCPTYHPKVSPKCNFRNLHFVLIKKS